MARKSSSSLPTTLEDALKALEKTVQKLETPELPLEESIKLFEKGTELSQICYSRLQDAEKKVEILMKKVPNPTERGDYSVESFATDNNA